MHWCFLRQTPGQFHVQALEDLLPLNVGGTCYLLPNIAKVVRCHSMLILWNTHTHTHTHTHTWRCPGTSACKSLYHRNSHHRVTKIYLFPVLWFSADQPLGQNEIHKTTFKKKNEVGGPTLPNFKTYIKAMVMKMVWYSHQDIHVD